MEDSSFILGIFLYFWALNPKPQTLKPKPQTPIPKPYTPNPKPKTLCEWRLDQFKQDLQQRGAEEFLLRALNFGVLQSLGLGLRVQGFGV